MGNCFDSPSLEIVECKCCMEEGRRVQGKEKEMVLESTVLWFGGDFSVSSMSPS
jgi:purine-cytosine permease-like protein